MGVVLSTVGEFEAVAAAAGADKQRVGAEQRQAPYAERCHDGMDLLAKFFAVKAFGVFGLNVDAAAMDVDVGAVGGVEAVDGARDGEPVGIDQGPFPGLAYLEVGLAEVCEEGVADVVDGDAAGPDETFEVGA